MKIVIKLDSRLLLSVISGFIVLGLAFSVAGALSPQSLAGTNVKSAEQELPEIATELTGSGVTSTFSISGMTCGGCVYRIKQALGTVAGVLSADISLSQRTGVVEYDPNKITPQEIADVITKTGYPTKEIDPSLVGSIPPSPSGSGNGCGCGCGG